MTSALPTRFDASMAGHVLRSVAEGYERPLAMHDLVAMGLRHFATGAPVIVTADSEQVTLTSPRGATVLRLDSEPAEPGEDDAAPSDAWGRLVGRALTALVEIDPRLAARADDDVMARFFDFLPNELDPATRYEPRGTARGPAPARLGILAATTADGPMVAMTLPSSPAESVGLRGGERILRIDGSPADGLSQQRLRASIAKADGTPVALAVERDGVVMNVTLERAVFPSRLAIGAVRRNVAVIRIVEFRSGTAAAVAETFATLKRQTPELAGVVLDLRGNPGGEALEGVAVADLFLERGRIASVRYPRNPEANVDYEARPGDITGGLPMAVLVNGGSASSSELVALALTENGRARSLGSTTFGKDTVQETGGLVPVSVTVGRYSGPKGGTVRAHGLAVEVCTTPGQALAPAVGSAGVRTAVGEACPRSYAMRPGDVDVAIDTVLATQIGNGP